MDETKGPKNESGGIADTLKKIISVGAGAAFMTEDAVRSVLNDLPISKEIVTSLLQSAKHSKEEFIDSVREELQKYLKSVDAKLLMDSLLERYDIELNTTVRFKKKKEATDGKGRRTKK